MYRFSREFRLVSKQDFQSVFANPKKASHKAFLALYKPNHRPYARLGVIISKQYVKRAVQRNLLRRLIREGFRHGKGPLKGLDIIVLLRSEWCSLNQTTLRDDIETLWAKLIK
jgi:ribonuclease P protein component